MKDVKIIVYCLLAIILGLDAGYLMFKGSDPKVIALENKVDTYVVRIDSLQRYIEDMKETWRKANQPSIIYRDKVKIMNQVVPIVDSDSLIQSVNNVIKNN